MNFSSSSGIRTHSISGSKPEWSASCLPSRIKGIRNFQAHPQGFEPRPTGLEPVMLPLHQRRESLRLKLRWQESNLRQSG